MYPYAQRKAANRTKETAGTGKVFSHDLLVLTTTDPLDKVKDFYRGRIKPNIVLDKSDPVRVVTMELAPAGQVTESFVSKVVLQVEPGGGTQITLSTYKPLP